MRAVFKRPVRVPLVGALVTAVLAARDAERVRCDGTAGPRILEEGGGGGVFVHWRSRAAIQAGPVRGRRTAVASVLAAAALVVPLAAGPALAVGTGTAQAPARQLGAGEHFARALAAAHLAAGPVSAEQQVSEIDRGFRPDGIDLDDLDAAKFGQLLKELRARVAPRTANGIPALGANQDGKYLALALRTDGKTLTLLINKGNLYLEAWERTTNSGTEIFPLEPFRGKWEKYAKSENAKPHTKVQKTGLPENYTQLGGLGAPTYGRYPLAQTVENLHDFKVDAGKKIADADVVRLAVTVSEATRFKAVESTLAKAWEKGVQLPKTHQDLINAWKDITRQLNEPKETIRVTLNGKTENVPRTTVEEKWLGVQHSCAIDAPGPRGSRALSLSAGSGSNPCGPPVDDPAAREEARAEAVAEAEKLPGRARERAKELCAKSGQASCLGEVDWEKVRGQARAEAERLTELKLAGLENVGEARLVKDLDAVVKNPSAFYVPYDKTRAKLGGERFNWSNVAHAGGAALWAAGVAQAFSGESSDLDKAAAITALMPVVGSLLQVGVDVQDQDFAGAGFDGFALLMEGLELAGVESAATGPAFAVAMVYHLAKTVGDIGAQLDENVKRVPDVRDKAWHDTLLNYLQDPKKGWLAKEGGTEAVAAGIGLVQAAEMQRAAVKGLAHAASTADGSGEVVAAETGRKRWSAHERFADADAKADALTGEFVKQLRSSLATSLAKGMNAAWEQKEGKEFNQHFIDKVYNNDWCGALVGAAAVNCAERMDGLQKEALAKLEKTPPGVTAAEVEDALIGMGMTDIAAPQRDTALAGLLTAQGASGQVDAVMPVPGTDREHWVFSGGQYVRMRLDEKADGKKLAATLTGNNKPAPVKGNWRSLEPLLDASKTGRVDAAMPVPGADKDLYVFSGDQYTRIHVDGDLNDTVVDGYEKPRSLPDNWSSLTGLFARSGARRVDAVHAVPGNKLEYYVFSGSWFTTIRLDSGLKDEQMVAPRRITAGWPKLIAETGKDHVQGLVPVPGADRDFYVFTDGGYVKASAKSLRLPTPRATANAAYDGNKAGIYWSNGEDVPGNTTLVAQEQGRPERSYPARAGKNEDWTPPVVDAIDAIAGQVPKTTVIDVHYEHTHQDGTVEKSPVTTVSFECWYMVCKGVPQHE